tara:strand:+ start:89 stop:736 length:648 start_codon:yes stop_codon:yes gene_type:complete
LEKNQVIIIPCYNEVSTIIKIYNEAKRYGKVIIIDDFSKDGTRELLKKNNIFFLKNKKNYGYEQTLINGFKFAIKKFKNINYILTLDADNELPTKYIPKIIKVIDKTNADIVIGNRNKLNRISEKVISLLFKFLFNIRDPLSGLKIYKRSFLKKYLNLISNNLFLVDLILFSINNGKKINTFLINVYKRKDKPRVGSSLKVNLKILKIIFNVIFK